MKEQVASASRVIDAPVERIYEIIADYRNQHPRILPVQYFLSLNVEEGGYGAGTIINFSMRMLGQTQNFRSLITEPAPGRLLVETDIRSQIPTSFEVVSTGDASRVTISTILKGRSWIEGLFAKPMLQKIYRQELGLLGELAAHSIKRQGNL
jgi:hypothetical protein